MKKKLAAFVLLLVAMVGLGAAPALAAPAEQVCETIVNDDNTIASQTCVPAKDGKAVPSTRWSYCNPTVSGDHITFFDYQGYCGSKVAMNAPAVGQCRYMGNWDNWAGSLSNNARDNIYAYDSSTCSGAVLSTSDGQDIADLYPLGFYNKITSISLT